MLSVCLPYTNLTNTLCTVLTLFILTVSIHSPLIDLSTGYYYYDIDTLFPNNLSDQKFERASRLNFLRAKLFA